MKLKTSLFKKGLIISDLKRFWWISVLYTLALLFILPLYHYVQKFNTNSLEFLYDTIRRDLIFQNTSSQIFLIVVPFLIGTLVFRYIQKSSSASLYHSLPLTRSVLYLNSVISALILFIAPLLFTTLIMLMLNCFSFLSAYYTTKLIFLWLLRSLLFGIMFISMTIFVSMFTGSSIAQLAFVYILNILPAFLVEFVRMNLSELLYGFDTYSNSNLNDNLPFLMIFRISRYSPGYETLTPTLVIVYILITLALFVGALFAFKLRRPETAGDIITFRPIKPIFIYGTTICATLLGGAYFMVLNKSSFAFIIFGYFICSLIAYVAVQMITHKSFKILHTYKGYIVFALILVIMSLGIKFDVIGYVNNIPNPSEIEESYVGYNLHWWQNRDNPNFEYYDDNRSTFVYKDPQNIENVTKLHKLILDKRSDNGNLQYIAYKLKNGKKIIRKYSIDTDLYASGLSPIYKSKEYKDGNYPILNQKVDDLKYIEISDIRRSMNDKPFVISDKAKLESFKKAIIKDIENSSYQDLASKSVSSYSFLNISTVINDKSKKKNNNTIKYGKPEDIKTGYTIRSSYTNTLDWLKKEGIYDEVVVKAEDLDSIKLTNHGIRNKNNHGYIEPKEVEITDKAIINELLILTMDATNRYNPNEPDYMIEFVQQRSSNGFSFSVDFDKVSPELQSYFDKIK